MFGSIGITELMLIAGIALVFLGPEKFPEFAKIVARTVRDVRGYVQEAQQEITKELKPVKDEIDKMSRENPEDYLDKLAKLADEDDDDTINPEPHPGELFTGDDDEDSKIAEVDGVVPYGPMDDVEGTGEVSEVSEVPEDSDAATPERLDG